jgi:hypothetical protein
MKQACYKVKVAFTQKGIVCCSCTCKAGSFGWCDFVERYDKSENSLLIIFNDKMRIVLESRKKWPMFATYNEDIKLQSRRWDQYYSNRRVIFWDNTNIDLVMPSDFDDQQNTFSSYYAGNVAKAAVCIQP